MTATCTTLPLLFETKEVSRVLYSSEDPRKDRNKYPSRGHDIGVVTVLIVVAILAIIAIILCAPLAWDQTYGSP